MKRGEVWKKKGDPVLLGGGGTLWVYESSGTYWDARTNEHKTNHYFVGPSLAEDGSHYHCMSFSVPDADIAEYEKHHDGFLNMPSEDQDKVRAEHVRK